MAGEYESSKGYTLEVELTPSTWTKIGQITNLVMPSPEQQFEDATHLESPCVEDGEPVGLATPGSCTGNVLYKPSGVHVTMANMAGEEDTEKVNFRIKRKSGVVHCTWPGTVKKFAPTAAVKSFIKADFESKCSEPPVYGDVTP